MAIAITTVAKVNVGNCSGGFYDIALDATYAAGGYAIAASDLGLGSIGLFLCQMKTGENLLPNYNFTTGKLEILKGASTVTVTTGSGAYSELATNDSYASATVIVRAFVLATPANKG